MNGDGLFDRRAQIPLRADQLVRALGLPAGTEVTGVSWDHDIRRATVHVVHPSLPVALPDTPSARIRQRSCPADYEEEFDAERDRCTEMFPWGEMFPWSQP